MNQYYHWTTFCALRTCARRLGVLALVKKLNLAGQREYEEPFCFALKQAVKPGDVIWDIGANIGIYTRQFLAWSAPHGAVVAFEPFPPTFATLAREIAKEGQNGRVSLQRIALSDTLGKAKFAVETDSTGDFVSTTAHLGDNSRAAGHCIEVEVNTVDGVRQDNDFPVPNVVKIDVEGFEEEVIRGGQVTFSHPSCRDLFVEVHFRRIAERKLGKAVPRMVKMLKDLGFRVQWADASHLCASK
jgi:FkbM family methyltransferase